MSSGYLDHLPAVWRDDPFAGEFLLAFEALFTGLDAVEQPGLSQLVEGVSAVLDPLTAPDGFLPWLAGWVALSVRADWDPDTTRGFIREVVPLYARRGTAAGLQRMLQIFMRPLGATIAGDDVVVIDTFDDLPHFFEVRLTLSDNDPVRLRATQETARAIIDREKPAHTFYALKVFIPTMRLVSEKSMAAGAPPLRLGQDTQLGTAG